MPPPTEERASSPTNPLVRFSLLGHEQELEDQAVLQKPLLGAVCMAGEATVWFASHGIGKTLIFLSLLLAAIDARLIDAAKVFYINVDDSSNGLAQKARILSEPGVHVLSQGHLGFKVAMLTSILEAMVENGSAAGTFIVIDTLKKFVDLMNKKEASAFAEIARRFVLRGGTLLGFAHVNKHRGGNGKVIYAGTSDIINDFDCAYSIDVVEETDSVRTVSFECLKSRGGGLRETAYAYCCEPDIDYLSRIMSVVEVDRSRFGIRPNPEPEIDEDVIVDALRLSIQHAKKPMKMAIIKTASLATGASRRTVLATLERFTGDDPAEHHWRYVKGARGAMLYSLLGTAPDG